MSTKYIQYQLEDGTEVLIMAPEGYEVIQTGEDRGRRG